MWQNEMAGRGPRAASLKMVVWRFIRTRSLVSVFILSLNIITSFISVAFVMRKLLEFAETPEAPASEVVNWAICLGVTELLRVIFYAGAWAISNSAVVVRKMLPDRAYSFEEAVDLYKREDWLAFINLVFRVLLDHGIKDTRIIEMVKSLSPTRNMVELLHFLYSHKIEIVLISDSNDIFINQWLEAHNVQSYVSAVYSNVAEINNEGLIQVHSPDSDLHCEIKQILFCKLHYINYHLQLSNEVKDLICYVGDGNNDICAAKRLRAKDFVFARQGFPLFYHTVHLNKEPKIRAIVHPWYDAAQIQSEIENWLQLNLDEP